MSPRFLCFLKAITGSCLKILLQISSFFNICQCFSIHCFIFLRHGLYFVQNTKGISFVLFVLSFFKRSSLLRDSARFMFSSISGSLYPLSIKFNLNFDRIFCKSSLLLVLRKCRIVSPLMNPVKTCRLWQLFRCRYIKEFVGLKKVFKSSIPVFSYLLPL